MATIQIHALNPAGADLFSDNESYLKELTDTEMAIEGGIKSSPTMASFLLDAPSYHVF